LEGVGEFSNQKYINSYRKRKVSHKDWFYSVAWEYKNTIDYKSREGGLKMQAKDTEGVLVIEAGEEGRS